MEVKHMPVRRVVITFRKHVETYTVSDEDHQWYLDNTRISLTYEEMVKFINECRGDGMKVEKFTRRRYK